MLKSTLLLVLAVVTNMSYVWNFTIQYKFNLRRYKARKWRKKVRQLQKRRRKKINTSVFPELPVITTEHEYGSLGLGKEHLKPRPLGKEYLKPRLFGLDNSMSPCYNVTVDKLRVAFHGDKYSLAGEN